MKYTDAALDALRQEGDPIPDAIVARLKHTGQVDEVNAVLRQLVHNAQGIPAELPDEIEHWLRETDKLPDDTDLARLERAQRFFVEYGLVITLILSTASFVEAYAAYPGVKVLTFSYRLGHNAYRRVAETAQFLLLVMSPGALGEAGQGIPAIQKVRLMHSAIRYLIGQSGRWDTAQDGVPICQEDMLGTIASVSWLVLDNMQKMDILLTPQEMEDYIYLWRVVGQMLGCRPDMLPANMDEAYDLTHAIRRRHHRASAEGQAMTRALMELHADLIPGTAFDGVMPAVTRFLVGEATADMVALPRSVWDVWVRDKSRLINLMDTLDRQAGVMADLVDHLGRALLTRQAIALNGYERASFDIPTQLQAAWHLEARTSS